MANWDLSNVKGAAAVEAIMRQQREAADRLEAIARKLREGNQKPIR